MKIDIFEPRTPSTLAPIYDTTFLFDSFDKREITPKEKSFTPIFSETSVNFRNFFTIVYVLTGATNDPGLRVLRFTVWGWGQKQIFVKGGKVFFALQKD